MGIVAMSALVAHPFSARHFLAQVAHAGSRFMDMLYLAQRMSPYGDSEHAELLRHWRRETRGLFD